MMRGRLSISSSDEMPRPQSRRRAAAWPWAALLAVVLVAAFEMGFVYQFRYRFWDSTYSLAEIKRRLLTSGAPADDVAILGNSRFYHVDPERLKEVFGPDARITNYAWAWCGMDIYEPMLRGMINAGRTPRIVIVDANAEMFGYRPELLSLAGDPSNQSRYNQTAPLLPGLRTELAQQLWGPAWHTFSSYLTPPSVVYGERVGKGLERLLKQRKLPKPRKDFTTYVEQWQQHGWFQFAAERVSDWDEYRHVETINGPYTLFDNPQARQAYERFLRLAQAHNVRVILLPVPHNTLQYEAYLRNGVYAAFDQWLNAMQEKYPVFSAPAPRWQDWPGMLGDAGHLNSAGIQRHMDLMVEMLKQVQEDGAARPAPAGPGS